MDIQKKIETKDQIIMSKIDSDKQCNDLKSFVVSWNKNNRLKLLFEETSVYCKVSKSNLTR